MKIRFLVPARRELKDAVLYYNAQRPHLGNEFRDEAWDTIQRIKKFPEACNRTTFGDARMVSAYWRSNAARGTNGIHLASE